MKEMKKIISLLLCTVMILSVCAACGSAPAATATAAPTGDTGPITVTDQAGSTVEVPRRIDRIAVVGIYPLPSVLAVFFNSAKKIVAMPEQSMTAAKNSLLGQLYPEILNAQTGCVSGDQVNTEELLKLNPDVVFYSASDAAIGEALKNAGFTAVALSVNKWGYNCLETLDNWISLLSEIFPENDKAAIVKDRGEKIYNLVQERVKNLTDAQKARVFVLFQYSDTNMLSSGKNFFGQWWCDAIGAVNVAEELEKENGVTVNMEQVYAWNPDVILVTNFTKTQPDDLYNNTVGSDDWSGVKAVQGKRVYKMPLGLYRSYTPGADTPITLLWLAKTVYPDLFSDIDVTAEAQSYYKDVFGVDLTAAQIESIFAPTSAAGAGF